MYEAQVAAQRARERRTALVEAAAERRFRRAVRRHREG